MATTAPSDIAPSPVPLRREVSPHHAYELTVLDNGVTLHAFETLGESAQPHDAALFFTPQQVVELRCDLAAALLRLEPPQFRGVTSSVGRAATEAFRAAFAAMDKVPGAEADEIYRAVVDHVRASRPWVLREVGL